MIIEPNKNYKEPFEYSIDRLCVRTEKTTEKGAKDNQSHGELPGK